MLAMGSDAARDSQRQQLRPVRTRHLDGLTPFWGDYPPPKKGPRMGKKSDEKMINEANKGGKSVEQVLREELAKKQAKQQQEGKKK
jgi:uncharacterized protein involved in outer membrane biogenesis